MKYRVKIILGFRRDQEYHAALIDRADVQLVEGLSWYAKRTNNLGSTKYYAAANAIVGGKRTTVKMHRLILGAERGEVVDHINGNTLDNRRSNLRICTWTENARNREAYSASGYKGVYPSKKTLGKYLVQIRVNGKKKHLGFVDDPRVGARLYDEAAEHYFGAFSRKNLCTN